MTVGHFLHNQVNRKMTGGQLFSQTEEGVRALRWDHPLAC